MADRTYEEFATTAAFSEKTSAIDVLLGYPNSAATTTTYRTCRVHVSAPDITSVVGVIDDELRAACSGMSATAKAVYYENDITEASASALGYRFKVSGAET